MVLFDKSFKKRLNYKHKQSQTHRLFLWSFSFSSLSSQFRQNFGHPLIMQ